MIQLLVISCFLAFTADLVQGHGMVLLPVNRASRWRHNNSAPANYDDNGLYCGGQAVMWGQNDGKCGLCGDDYSKTAPREHELGGFFGEGVIVERYPVGSNIFVQIMITANHMGDFTFKLCNLDQFKTESDECFMDLPLMTSDGKDKFVIEEKRLGLFNVTLALPPHVSCEHCVLQWTWRAGNTWGSCETGPGGLGCGDQETFRTCSDISVMN